MTEKSPKTVLITGAAGGIGRATVHLFAKYGWLVIGVDRAPFASAPGLTASLSCLHLTQAQVADRPGGRQDRPFCEGFPDSGLFIQSDISDPEALETAKRVT